MNATPSLPDLDLTSEAERSVLGSLLISSEAWPPEVELLSPADFSTPARANVFRAAIELHDRAEPVDTITVLGELREVDKPPEGGWPVYLADLSASVLSAANLGHYAALVARESRRRDYLSVMIRAVEQARAPGADADGIATEALLRLGRIAESREIARPESMRSLAKKEIRDLDHRRGSETPIGHATGFECLDRLTCGLLPGHLVIIAGRPSMGKSSLARNILVTLGKREVGSVLFSLEMRKQEIFQAAVASEARVNLQRLRTGKLKEDEYSQAVEGMSKLYSDAACIIDRPALSVQEIRAISRAHAARNPLGVVCVDYLQLARGNGRSREEEISSITRGLKALALELEVPVIALSQLNRGLESRTDKRPRLADLRESGAIEQDADEVLFVYRDEYYNADTKHPGTAEIAVAKCRNGPTGMVRLKWIGQFTRFESL